MKYNLSTICKTANCFHKQGYSRSAAFVLAWRLIKEKAAAKISGVKYADRQDILEIIAKRAVTDVKIRLERESGNIYDKNAIAVIAHINSKSFKLGYVPSKAARLFAGLMDAGQAVTAAINRIIGGWGEGINYGAILNFSI